MTRTTLAACLATLTLAVPKLLDADIQTDGPKVKPDEQVMHLDGADVAMQIDRGTLAAGNTVSAVLVATADKPHAVTVDLRTLEDMGYGGERVPNPPLQVDRRTLTLKAQPGGGPPVVATIKLGSKKQKLGAMSWFDMYLLPHGQRPPDNRYEAPDTGAHAGIVTWSGNSFPMTIEPPAQLPAEGPFTVAVRVKNTSSQGWKYCFGHIGGALAGYNEMDGGLQLADDELDMEAVGEGESGNGEDIMVAPGAERVMIYRVTPKHAGIDHFTIVAHFNTDTGGAMEIASFDRPPQKPADVKTPAVAAR
jgi:hypothetical protein